MTTKSSFFAKKTEGEGERRGKQAKPFSVGAFFFVPSFSGFFLSFFFRSEPNNKGGPRKKRKKKSSQRREGGREGGKEKFGPRGVDNKKAAALCLLCVPSSCGCSSNKKLQLSAKQKGEE